MIPRTTHRARLSSVAALSLSNLTIALRNGSLLAATAALGMMTLMPLDASAAACVKGVYRAGCAGPNGAAVVRK